jgi:uncharacterized protein (TIGR03643 family)
MELTEADIDRIVEMAWEDRTPFEAIETQFGINNQGVIELMRRTMKPSSFKMWRKRTTGRKTKHTLLSGSNDQRFKCTRQRFISMNRLSKR